MNNKDFVKKISQKLSLNTKETQVCIQQVITTFTQCMEEDDEIILSEDMTFKVEKEKEKICIDKVNKKRTLLPPCLTLKFNNN